MRLKIELAYDGTHYFGWQIQPNQISIQQTIQDKLKQLTGQDIELVGCGRTDTGVHASQYFAHCDIDEILVDKINVYNLNAILPHDISILNIVKTSKEFHSRFSALHRKYIYRIHNFKDPFNRNYSFFYSLLNVNHLPKLNEVAQMINNMNSFESFVKSNSGLDNYQCQITQSEWKLINEHQFEYHIAANRFVRGMVRLCVGASLSYAIEKINIEEITNAILSKIQIPKSWSVPANGLSLTEIRY